MSDISLKTYNKTGFGKTDGSDQLKATLATIPTSDEALKAQAEAQYTPTFEIEKQSLTQQMSALIQSQANDSELLNKNYQQSVNTMMAKLKERGINTGAVPDSTEAALKTFYNETMTQRQLIYNQQQEAVRKKQQTLEGNYEQNVIARMSANRLNNLKSATDLMQQIAQLQSSSFQNYTNYLLQKKAASHRGGGGGWGRGGWGRYGRYGRGGSGGVSAGSTGSSGSSLPVDYFMGNGKPKVQGLAATYAKTTRKISGALTKYTKGKTKSSSSGTGGAGRR